ncbi:sarcoplasmic reticulum histidine-rich calcium-binding protein [Streptomyces sp. NRRL F-6602]|nr:sarcoplasmic reticulum histidine-rich calcium-binding protein [Streptomyces sp. NRRL F-6602]
MRIRATVAVVSGALALSALTGAAAQAAPGPDRERIQVPTAESVFGKQATAKGKGFKAAAVPKISKVTVNGGKDIVLGTTKAKTFSVSITASHASNIGDAYAYFWHGSTYETADGVFIPNEEYASCKASSATTSTCKLTFTVDPQWELINDLAAWNDKHSKTRVQRYSKLVVNATPEPVKKGKTLTVNGTLSRANWDTWKYAGYTQQSVKLQFKKKGAASYTTVKTVKSGSKGALKTTVKAASDGYWRWSFAGTSTTPAINSTADFVDVK